MKVNLKKVKKSTFVYIGLICAGSAAAQKEWVRDHVITFAQHHPHFAFLPVMLTTIIAILHNPQVAQTISDMTCDDEAPGSK